MLNCFRNAPWSGNKQRKTITLFLKIFVFLAGGKSYKYKTTMDLKVVIERVRTELVVAQDVPQKVPQTPLWWWRSTEKRPSGQSWAIHVPLEWKGRVSAQLIRAGNSHPSLFTSSQPFLPSGVHKLQFLLFNCRTSFRDARKGVGEVRERWTHLEGKEMHPLSYWTVSVCLSVRSGLLYLCWCLFSTSAPLIDGLTSPRVSVDSALVSSRIILSGVSSYRNLATIQNCDHRGYRDTTWCVRH